MTVWRGVHVHRMWGQWLQKLVGPWLGKKKGFAKIKYDETGFEKTYFFEYRISFSGIFLRILDTLLTYLFIISFVTLWLIHKYSGHLSKSHLLNLGLDQCLESHLRRVAERIPESLRQAGRPGRPQFPFLILCAEKCGKSEFFYKTRFWFLQCCFLYFVV